MNLRFFKGEFKSVNDLDAAAPNETLESRSIQLPQFATKTGDLKQPFGAIFEGYISVPENAIYEFQIEADDFARLEIGGETLIDAAAAADDANGKTITKYGLAPLEKGFHKIRLRYVQAGENAILNLRWGVKGTGLRRIYGNELWR